MKTFWIITVLLCAIILPETSSAQNPDAAFTGPGILTNYQAPGKPTKVKNQITLTFNSANINSTFQVNDDMFPSSGKGYIEGRYMYAQYQTGGTILAGRLLVKGSPGAETGLSGILTSTHNGYAGMHEYKVNLKRVNN